MTCKEWRDGYATGFWDGYEKGKREGQTSPYVRPPLPAQDDWLRAKNIGTKCHACGMFFEAGKAYGYVCGYHNCPSKPYCSTTASATSNVCISSSNSQFVPWYSVNTVPDGLSYEEIYGSVVYQQERKKST